MVRSIDRHDYRTGSCESQENYWWVDRWSRFDGQYTISSGPCHASLWSHISYAVEQYVGVSSASSEQHIYLRESRKVRDKSDVDKIIDWFTAHSPFHQTPPELISLSTGIVADNETNCEQAYEFGQSEIVKLTEQAFIDVHYSRKRRVKSLATSSMGVKLRNDVVDVNPHQLFNMIICVIRSDADLADCFKYEWSPTSASLFDNTSMRNTNKARLAKII